ncbi:MAG: hypothetical protein HYR85_06510, partial [Planctomycetes bacterium]|nr:hypothetical protein [Planctomycetota bacterium]
MQTKKVHFVAWSLQDGTIWLTLPTKKPGRNTIEAARIDEDGVHTFYVERITEKHDHPDWVKATRNAAICGSLNTKRALRAQIEPKLAALERRLELMQAQLDRIE